MQSITTSPSSRPPDNRKISGKPACPNPQPLRFINNQAFDGRNMAGVFSTITDDLQNITFFNAIHRSLTPQQLQQLNTLPSGSQVLACSVSGSRDVTLQISDKRYQQLNNLRLISGE